MSTLTLSVDRRLAHTVRLTGNWRHRQKLPRFVTAAAAGLDFAARGVFYLWRNRGYLTVFKLINMGAINLQFFLKTEHVIGRPYKMKLEPTNVCNTKCQLCPTGLEIKGRPKGKMPYADYTKLIDKLRRHLFALDLSMWGDPLIVPEIYDMISYAHKQGIWTYLSSNLHAFKPERGHADRLVLSGLDMLTCSLHGASQETFEYYQPGKNFQETVDKVRALVEARKRHNRVTPEIQLNFVVTRHNEHERPAFEALARSLDCRAVFSTAAMNVRFLNQDKNLQSLGLAPDLLKKKTRDHLQQWLPEDPAHVLEPYKRMLDDDFDPDRYNGHKPIDCSWPWRSSVINWDGTVVTCCGSYDPEHDMGNALTQPFGKIWNGDTYRMARRSFKHRLTPEQAEGNACAKCPGFML